MRASPNLEVRKRIGVKKQVRNAAKYLRSISVECYCDILFRNACHLRVVLSVPAMWFLNASLCENLNEG